MPKRGIRMDASPPETETTFALNGPTGLTPLVYEVDLEVRLLIPLAYSTVPSGELVTVTT